MLLSFLFYSLQRPLSLKEYSSALKKRISTFKSSDEVSPTLQINVILLSLMPTAFLCSKR